MAILIKRYKRSPEADLSPCCRDQLAIYNAINPADVTVVGPVIERDVVFADGFDAAKIADLHARILADGWEYVEDDPADVPSMICDDDDELETRVSTALKDLKDHLAA